MNIWKENNTSTNVQHVETLQTHRYEKDTLGISRRVFYNYNLSPFCSISNFVKNTFSYIGYLKICGRKRAKYNVITRPNSNHDVFLISVVIGNINEGEMLIQLFLLVSLPLMLVVANLQNTE